MAGIGRAILLLILASAAFWLVGSGNPNALGTNILAFLFVILLFASGFQAGHAVGKRSRDDKGI